MVPVKTLYYYYPSDKSPRYGLPLGPWIEGNDAPYFKTAAEARAGAINFLGKRSVTVYSAEYDIHTCNGKEEVRRRSDPVEEPS